MSTTAVFYPHAIQPPDGDAITQLTDLSPGYNFADFVEFAAGEIAPMFSGSLSSTPEVPFQTRQGKTVFQLMTTAGGLGHTVGYNGSSGNTDLYYKKGEGHGFRVADATVEHERIRCPKVLIYWTNVTAAQGSPAEFDLRLLPTFDGATEPMVITQAAIPGTLNWSTENVEQAFTLGPMDINGTDIDGLQSVSIAMNVQIEAIADSGGEFINYAGLVRYSPVVTFTARNASLMRTFTNRGTAVTAFTQYFRRIKEHQILNANADLAHLKITGTTGVVKVRSISGTGNVAGMVQLEQASSGAHPITLAVDQAIT